MPADLLFVSNYGEGGERRIAFAHFSQTEEGQDLPMLKVLGWDNLDTPVHLDDANMESVVRDFGDKNPQEDPVIRFYELFLKEYDAGLREVAQGPQGPETVQGRPHALPENRCGAQRDHPPDERDR